MPTCPRVSRASIHVFHVLTGDDGIDMKKFSPMFKEVFIQLFKKPVTQKYPLVQPVIPDYFRGKQVFNIDLCISCGLCAKDCPSQAIEMVAVGEKKHPLFHLDLCIFCYQCAESCPRHAIMPSKIFELASVDKTKLVVKPAYM